MSTNAVMSPVAARSIVCGTMRTVAVRWGSGIASEPVIEPGTESVK
ncbi:MAG: hypothetical protein ACYDCI_05975 [Candidatus Limnocylindrales bacterium]